MTTDHPLLPERAPLRPHQAGAYLSGAFLAAYVEAAKSVDLEPYHHLRQARLPTSDLDGDEVVIPYRRFIELLNTSARLAQRPDFFLCVGKALSLASFGPVGLLASAQPTLKDALDVMCEGTLHPHRMVRATLETRDETAILRLSLKCGAERFAGRWSELALGAALRVIQGLVGGDWRPLSTSLSLASSGPSEAYRDLFGEVLFDQPFDELRLSASDLVRPIPTANPSLARLAAHYLTEIRPPAARPFADEVRELVDALLPRGLCTIERVADHLGIDRRTVHRRLAEQGRSFSELVQTARHDLVQAELRDSTRPIATLAQSLGFSCNSTFSRWFRQTYGVSATQFRRAA